MRKRKLKLPDIAWCTVPAGVFIMGSDGGQKREQPQHTLHLPYSYQIAKYPLTNAQYGLFIEAGGYSKVCRHHWTEAGWRQMIDQRSYKHPFLWRNEDYNLANHPAVVSWYEAVAYCHWLTEQLQVVGELAEGQVIRLPTEAEWEKAARGTDGRIYPWGNDEPTPAHANYRETGSGIPSAVGCLPHGASPYGCLDMAGNVWEWCATKPDGGYKPYPYTLENEWSDDYLAGDSPRMMRGGAFFRFSDNLRASVRLRFNPNLNLINPGIRIICVPI